MENCSQPKLERVKCQTNEPLALGCSSLENLQSERGSITVPQTLTPELQERMAVVQRVVGAQGTKDYAQVQQAAARQLGISVRSLRRLVKSWRQQGIAGLSRQPRTDVDEVKISQEWQQFIIKTYQDGNLGSRCLSGAQVFIRVKVQAQTVGEQQYPSRATVYRVLNAYLQGEQRQKRSIGCRGDRLILRTNEGLEIPIEWSNQMWQCDHTQADVLVVDQQGAILGRPYLTIIIDTYSRCIMGMHLGFDAPSAAVVCLALRHAILPKQYSSAYELKEYWGTYGLPQYLYTDKGKDFRSQHLEQVASELGIVLCLRRKPSDGGIVERPFGSFSTQFFSSLPGYVNSNVTERSPKAESEACLTLLELEKLFVRYLVDHYNQTLDARMGNQTRIGRWEAGRIAQLKLFGERELDICLMRRDQRLVYRNGYVQFANLVYQGEHLAAYAGERVVMRYNPRDITTVLIYEQRNDKEYFLTRAHAQGLETEFLSHAEAKAISRQLREAGKAISNQSVLNEVRDRDRAIAKTQGQKRRKANAVPPPPITPQPSIAPTDAQANQLTLPLVASAAAVPATIPPVAPCGGLEESVPPKIEPVKPKKPVPFVRVYESYEHLKRESQAQ